jgi:hypothetical protein
MEGEALDEKTSRPQQPAPRHGQSERGGARVTSQRREHEIMDLSRSRSRVGNPYSRASKLQAKVGDQQRRAAPPSLAARGPSAHRNYN